MGERLVVDPNKNSILFFGARSGHGLWTSTDSGVTWTQVTSLPNKGLYFDGSVTWILMITLMAGTYAPDPNDATGYNSDPIGVAWVTFDSTSGSSGTATPRVFVGVVSNGTDNVFVSEDAGSTCNVSYSTHAVRCSSGCLRVCNRRSTDDVLPTQGRTLSQRKISLHQLFRWRRALRWHQRSRLQGTYGFSPRAQLLISGTSVQYHFGHIDEHHARLRQ